MHGSEGGESGSTGLPYPYPRSHRDPRYWELAADYPDLWQAVQNLVLDPMGVLHHEPTRLLLDDMRETTQTASILSLIGSGCHRISEIGGFWGSRRQL